MRQSSRLAVPNRSWPSPRACHPSALISPPTHFPAHPPNHASCRAFTAAQAVVQAAVGWRCAADLPFCFLLQTLALVAFNKARGAGCGLSKGRSKRHAGARRGVQQSMQGLWQHFAACSCCDETQVQTSRESLARRCHLPLCRSVPPSTSFGTCPSCPWCCQTWRRRPTG